MRYCAYCEYNDGCVYTSLPPQYKCTVTGEFHLGDHTCSVEFAPVKHGRWIEIKDDVFASTYKCSECGSEPFIEDGKWALTDYCPHCGARMYTERKES